MAYDIAEMLCPSVGKVQHTGLRPYGEGKVHAAPGAVPGGFAAALFFL